MLIVLKLSNGETVLGLLALEDEDVFVIQDPFHLEMRADAKGYRQLLLYRYNQFSKEPHMSFSKDHIVGNYYPDDDLEEYYWYSLDHTIKFRDVNMSTDNQRASNYIQKLIDNENNPDLFSSQEDHVPVSITTSGNTVH
jgi:hypothetical protein